MKNCQGIFNRDDSFKGAHCEIREIVFGKKTSSGESAGYETRESEVEYSAWYKLAD